MVYKQIFRRFFFWFNPETAHFFTLKLIGIIDKIPMARSIIRFLFKYENPKLEREVFGIKFPNPVGLAGGLDKDAKYYNQLSDFGFGFVEIGSITPEPQSGNPKPRVFRIPTDKALINRMGINNNGVLEAIKHLKSDRPRTIISANIAKNTQSQGDQVAKDYDRVFSLLYDFVDMFTLNLSCPNVDGLCNLQDVSSLSDILDDILDKRMNMYEYKPILLKISPDLSKEQISDIIDYSLRVGIDGIVATNTTKSREGLSINSEKIENIGNGGMSGAPLFKKSLEMVKFIHEKSKGKLPIIAVGGIMSPEDADKMFDAGASLIELYSGFIYEGPGLIKRILKSLVSNN